MSLAGLNFCDDDDDDYDDDGCGSDTGCTVDSFNFNIHWGNDDDEDHIGRHYKGLSHVVSLFISQLKHSLHSTDNTSGNLYLLHYVTLQ